MLSSKISTAAFLVKKVWWKRFWLMIVFLCYLNPAVFSAELAAATDDPVKMPQIIELDHNTIQINIISPVAGVSYNRLKRCNLSNKKILVNNSGYDLITKESGIVSANPFFTIPAKLILFEVVGSEASEFKNVTIEIIGEQSKIIFSNPLGVNFGGEVVPLVKTVFLKN